MSTPSKSVQQQIERLESLKRNLSSPPVDSTGQHSKSSRVEQDEGQQIEIDETHGLAPPGDIDENLLEDLNAPPKWASAWQQVLLSGVRDVVQQEIKPLKEEVSLLTTKVEEVDINAKHAADMAKEAKDIATAVRTEWQATKDGTIKLQSSHSTVIDDRINSIETELGKLKLPSAHVSTSQNILVMGGFGQVSQAAATQWIERALRASNVTLPQDIYKKGKPEDPFKGMLFIKFPSVSEASPALTSLKSAASPENFGKGPKDRLWCDFEEPLEKRICKSFLFSLKSQLVEWKYPQGCVQVEKDLGVLKVEGKPVVKVAVVGAEFKIEWLVESWATWAILQNSAELLKIIADAKEKIAKSRERVSKGVGKAAMQ